MFGKEKNLENKISTTEIRNRAILKKKTPKIGLPPTFGQTSEKQINCVIFFNKNERKIRN